MTTDDALTALRDKSAAYQAANRAALDAKRERDDALVAAQAAGATYPQMATASGVSRDRVAQVLARQRQHAAAS